MEDGDKCELNDETTTRVLAAIIEESVTHWIQPQPIDGFSHPRAEADGFSQQRAETDGFSPPRASQIYADSHAQTDGFSQPRADRQIQPATLGRVPIY